MNGVFTFQQNADHVLLVDAFLNDSGDLEFVVGGTMERKSVVLDREHVGELFNALGKHLGQGDGQTYVVMCDDARTKIMGEVHAERQRQDAQWGGPAHDDEHTADTDGACWRRFIERQINRAFVEQANAANATSALQRARYMKMAALAVAGIESIDRLLFGGDE